MVRLEGIEPPLPVSKTGALSIKLQAQECFYTGNVLLSSLDGNLVSGTGEGYAIHALYTVEVV